MANDYYRVWFAGPRAWEAKRPVSLVLRRLVQLHGRANLIIVQGEAPGVDTIAKNLAIRNGIHTAGVPALWNKLGRSAGPMRNKAISGLEPHLLVAFHFWDELIKHPGTFSAVSVAHEAKIPVKLYHLPPDQAMPSSIVPESPMGNRARAEQGLPPKPPRARRNGAGRRRDA